MQNSISLPRLGIVVPCFNEQEVLPETTTRLVALLQRMIAAAEVAPDSAIFFVDDGSHDATWADIGRSAASNALVCGIKLSRNRGHQNALLCGLMTAPGDLLVSVDADLQDDLEVIPQMVREYRKGAEIVYAVRRRRDTDTVFKRVTAEGYYRLLAALNVEVVFNHADYRLMSRMAVETLRSYPETHLFLRGLVPQLGFRSATVEFDRAERFAGESKYPLSKMLALALQGVTSFTAYPLRLITGAGFLISLVSIGFALWAVGVRLLTTDALPGWASTVIPMYFLGGVQLLGLGMIGEYLAKVFEASKQRPRYHVEALCGTQFAQSGADASSVSRAFMR